MSSKGILLALSTVLVWAVLNVVNRFCVLSYGTNVMVFTAFMIFSTGISLMLIRQPVTTGNWKSGVKYSWLYTIMQIIRSFTMTSAFLYITSTETSLLFNIEIIITYILAYAFFRRIPYKGDYLGILVILTGFTLFIFTLPEHQRTIVSILILISATASCIRSIVIEETTIWSPETTVRQKCGISGYTMFYGGLYLVLFFYGIALLRFFFDASFPPALNFLHYLPSLGEMLHPETVISACITGFFINACSTFLYYTTLKYSTSETFMTVRVFQPVITYLFEITATLYYTAMRPRLTKQDYILGGIIIIGSLLILVIPQKGSYTHQSKDFITD